MGRHNDWIGFHNDEHGTHGGMRTCSFNAPVGTIIDFNAGRLSINTRGEKMAQLTDLPVGGTSTTRRELPCSITLEFARCCLRGER